MLPDRIPPPWAGICGNCKRHGIHPEWKQVYDTPMIMQEIYEPNVGKWVPAK